MLLKRITAIQQYTAAEGSAKAHAPISSPAFYASRAPAQKNLEMSNESNDAFLHPSSFRILQVFVKEALHSLSPGIERCSRIVLVFKSCRQNQIGFDVCVVERREGQKKWRY